VSKRLIGENNKMMRSKTDKQNVYEGKESYGLEIRIP
jgi:hypothetical protein